MLDTGTTAPAFTGRDQNDQEHSLADYAGKWVLLYFYPQDDTPGCTDEACAIAAAYNDFADRDVTVIGVSMDSVTSHQTFAEKNELPFTLIADESGEVVQAYQAQADPAETEPSAMQPLRVSYLIAPDGTIAKAYEAVDPTTHAAELLADITKLQRDQE